MRVRILTAMIFLFLFGMAQTSRAWCPWRCSMDSTETQNTATCTYTQARGDKATCELFYDCMGGYCDVWCKGADCLWV